MQSGKSFVSVSIKATGLNEAKLAALSLASRSSRKSAVEVGALAALDSIRGYYATYGRDRWINPTLPTHGPGRVPTQWWRSTQTGWFMGRATANGVRFSNSTIGLAHKITGGTIRAKRKKFLTIPITPRAHGMTAKRYSQTISPLFRVKGVLAEATDDGGINPVFALVKSVTHKPWPGALPPEDSYLTAFANGVLDSLAAEMMTTK